MLAGCSSSTKASHRHDTSSSSTTPATTASVPTETVTIPGMPPVLDPANIYSQIKPSDLQAQFASWPHRVFVPNGANNTVSVLDADTKTVLSTFKTGRQPQHVVPSYDLTKVWVLDNQGNNAIPVDPITGTPGKPVPVDDPYNLYFTPDGKYAIVVAERYQRLDYYTPDLKTRQFSVTLPECEGVNHGDWSADGRYALFTCEFQGNIAKVDIMNHTVVGYITVGGMPQDLRAGPDGRTFYVADMMAGGVHIVAGDTFSKTGFVATGIGAHGLTVSRDAKRLFVANRGTDKLPGAARRHSPGSLSILDLATNVVSKTIPVPDGGSPDMGNLDVSGNELWLSGRFDDEAYVFNVTPGLESFGQRVPVGSGPHGLAVMPQPGRYSLGHTGNIR